MKPTAASTSCACVLQLDHAWFARWQQQQEQLYTCQARLMLHSLETQTARSDYVFLVMIVASI